MLDPSILVLILVLVGVSVGIGVDNSIDVLLAENASRENKRIIEIQQIIALFPAILYSCEIAIASCNSF